MFIVLSRHQNPSVILSCFAGRGVGAGVCIVVGGAVVCGSTVVVTVTGAGVSDIGMDPAGAV
ncbi:MAG: hypothetical protein WCB46_02795 [Methanoregula sp.]